MDYKDWAKNLRECSFKGVKFFINSAEDEVGAIITVEEGKYKTNPTSLNEGRRLRNFSFSAFIIGEDAWGKSEKLRIACEDIKDGELIHPKFGLLTVYSESFKRILEKKDFIKLDLLFVESGHKIKPTIIKKSTAELENSVDLLDKENEEYFASDYYLPDVNRPNNPNEYFASDYYLPDIKRDIKTAGEIAKSTIEQIKEKIKMTEDAIDDVNDTIMSLDSMVDDVFYYLRKPKVFASKIQAGFDLLTKTIDKTGMGLLNLLGISNNKTGGKSISTLQTFLKVANLNSQAKILPLIDFKNRYEATEYLQEFNKQTENILNTMPYISPNYVNAFENMTAEVGKYIKTIIINSKNYKKVNLKEITPAIVLSYNLYGDIKNSEKIIKENNIKHPLFVPKGIDIEVLEN